MVIILRKIFLALFGVAALFWIALTYAGYRYRRELARWIEL